MTELKALSYKIDEDLSNYCRNNNTSETLHENHLVAAFGGERFHRPPSNAKKDAWIRYVQTCFYKNSLKGILVPKEDIIWKALNLESPPECSSGADESPGVQQQSSMSQLGSSIYGGTGSSIRDDQSMLSSIQSFRHQHNAIVNNSNNDTGSGMNLYENNSKHPWKNNRDDIESNHGTEHSYASSIRISDRNNSITENGVIGGRSRFSDLQRAQENGGVCDDNATRKKRRFMSDSSAGTHFSSLDAAQSVDYFREKRTFQVPERLNEATLSRRETNKFHHAEEEEKLRMGLSSSLHHQQSQQNDLLRSSTSQQHPPQLADTLRHHGAAGSVGNDGSSSLLGNGYLDLLQDRTNSFQNDLFLQRNNLVDSLSPAPSLSAATSSALRQQLPQRAVGERELLSSLQRSQQQRNIEASFLNAERSSLASTSSFLGSLGGFGGDIVGGNGGTFSSFPESALLLEQLEQQRRTRREQELLAQSSLLSSSLSNSLANQSLLLGRGPQTMSEDTASLLSGSGSRVLGGGLPSMGGRDQVASSLSSMLNAARLEEERRRILAAVASSSPSLPAVLSTNMPSLSALSEEARQMSTRNHAILQSLDARQQILEEQLRQTKAAASSATVRQELLSGVNQPQNDELRISGVSSLSQFSRNATSAGVIDQQNISKETASRSRSQGAPIENIDGVTSANSAGVRNRGNDARTSMIRRKTNITRDGSNSPVSKGRNDEDAREKSNGSSSTSNNGSGACKQNETAKSKSPSPLQQGGSKNNPLPFSSSSSSDEDVAPTIRNNDAKTPSILTTSLISEVGDEKFNEPRT